MLMDSELARKMRAELGTVSWSWLRPHAKRGILFQVAVELDLLAVGLAVAEDRVKEVEIWLVRKRLARPTSEQLEGWEDRGGLFSALIVKPYVFFKELEQTPEKLQ
ncbi:MAG: DUF2288 family protein [Deltaproteobacteria bacterium]|nr:DUF2288 family protein [Deltaproteobacteria bacterium]